MKFSGEWHEDGTITVTLPSGTHRVTECCFRFDGPEPIADLSHIVGGVVRGRPEGNGGPRGLDSPPDEE